MSDGEQRSEKERAREREGERERWEERNEQDNRKIDEERTKGKVAFVDGSGHCHNAVEPCYREVSADHREQRVFARLLCFVCRIFCP